MGLQGFDLPFLASMTSLRSYLCLKRGCWPAPRRWGSRSYAHLLTLPSAGLTFRASLNLWTTISAADPKSPAGKTGASRTKDLSFSISPDRLSHKCLFVTISATRKQPMARATCLVIQRARSDKQRSSLISAGATPPAASASFSRSACNTEMVCRVSRA